VDRAGKVEVEVVRAGEDARDERGGSVGHRGADGAGECCMGMGFIGRGPQRLGGPRGGDW
jgi:hypothetical protein